MKQTLIILCGGRSGEHEVSLMSAASIVKFIPNDKYNVIPVGIDKEGNWLMGSPFFKNEGDPATIALADDLEPARLKNGSLGGKIIDAVFPVVHGTFGEDGCLQGTLRMLDVPFVGSGVLGSAVAMDKDITKRLLIPEGIPSARHIILREQVNPKPSYEEVKNKLGNIVFVKPCNLGSSVGISKCRNQLEYDRAIKLAFSYDTKILVEQYIKGREIELAVFGHEELIISPPGEIIPEDDFYSYEAKYISSDKTQLKYPVELEASVLQNLRDYAAKTFRLLELSGLARIDFFLEEGGKIWLNEVNTLPGFTSISMYPKLMELAGVSYPDLIHRLVQLAIYLFKKEQALNRNFKN